MNDLVLVGHGTQIVSMPRARWEAQVAQAPVHIAGRLSFMSASHHRVRYFVVKELPRRGRPLSPQLIAEELELPLSQVKRILEELERHLFFLTRDESGAVAWAYPVTAERTPHQLSFSSGESGFAA